MKMKLHVHLAQQKQTPKKNLINLPTIYTKNKEKT